MSQSELGETTYDSKQTRENTPLAESAGKHPASNKRSRRSDLLQALENL